jgi:hypothetical protein
VLRTLLGALLSFTALELSIFHTNVYPSFLNPASPAGTFESTLYNELHRQKDGPNQVLCIGHSRMGLMPRVANELMPETGYTFASVAVAGTQPRDWYYMLRDADPAPGRYAAVVITLDDYDDDETWEDLADRELDTRLIIARLRLADLLEYPSSFRTWQRKWQAFRSILFKGSAYSRDFQDFVTHPKARIESAIQVRRDSHTWVYDYVGTSQTMLDVSVDWATRSVRAPPDRTADQLRDYTIIMVQPFPAFSGKMSKYMHQWLGKIYQRYRGSRTRLIFVRVPRGIFVRPDLPPTNPNSAVRELALQPGVTLIDEHAFDFLEHPQFFWDQVHLNQPGVDLFSRQLARSVREILGPPK